ncbi:transaldolase [Pinisolibacter sp.]|uniref:transaldolase n=1 Tax=Pinisolibacter sp. TaxID=2172024 RepID=UPI002FDCB2AE
MALSKLEQLRTMTTIVADTGDFEAVRRLRPVDCTTNPTLVAKAIALPHFTDLVEASLAWGRTLSGERGKVIEAIADRLAVEVGARLCELVPGRVSTEVDADLSFDTVATVAKARSIVAAYAARGIPRERILIKIAATWEGVRAAEILQREGIDCNLTLIFSVTQAVAAADAGAFLISPFVGRILDWWVKATGKSYTAAEDPGVRSVAAIWRYFKAHGVSTVVMGASFRNVGEIEELAGCDRLTISPQLLDELAAAEGPLERRLIAQDGEAPSRIVLDEKSFRWRMNQDAMASEKLAEGIRLFARDLVALKETIDTRL